MDSNYYLLNDNLSTFGHVIDTISGSQNLRRLNSQSTFGILSELDPVITTVCFAIIVAAVLFTKCAFSGLLSLTVDTPFERLLIIVEKELMYAGCTAFIFKIIVNATQGGLAHDWLLGLEYSDLIVPIFSFIYCGLGVLLIIVSMKACYHWRKAYHIPLLDLLNSFYDTMLSYLSPFVYFLPNKAVSQLEFRIFHNIFCDFYQIQRKAFAFDEYIDKVFEKLVMEIIEIRILDWCIVTAIYLANFIRAIPHLQLFGKNCDVTGVDSHVESHYSSYGTTTAPADEGQGHYTSASSSANHDCKEQTLTELFALGGKYNLL
jgi:hypothetical protein